MKTDKDDAGNIYVAFEPDDIDPIQSALRLVEELKPSAIPIECTIVKETLDSSRKDQDYRFRPDKFKTIFQALRSVLDQAIGLTKDSNLSVKYAHMSNRIDNLLNHYAS